jgi:hypothetical protein
MAKAPDEKTPDVATQIMARMVRMPPKPHDEMKLGKPRGKPNKSPKAKKKPRRFLAGQDDRTEAAARPRNLV